MTKQIPSSVAPLLNRARKLNSLIDKKTHPQVSLALQRAYGGLAASAQMLPLLLRASTSQVQKNVQAGRRSKVLALTAAFRIKTIRDRFPELMESAEHMAYGRDIEVYKVLGRRTLTLAIGIGAKLSGIGYVKDAAEVLATLKEAAETGQAIRLRRDQARAASELLRWADAISLLTIAWCYSAESFLDDIVGKSQRSQPEIMERVIRRIARNARNWNHP